MTASAPVPAIVVSSVSFDATAAAAAADVDDDALQMRDESNSSECCGRTDAPAGVRPAQQATHVDTVPTLKSPG